MTQEMSLIIEIKKQDIEIMEEDKTDQERFFKLMKEFLEKNKGEYPNFALASMIMDSLESDSNIFRLNRVLTSSPLQTKFRKV